MTKEVEHGTIAGWQVISNAGPNSTPTAPFIEDAALIINQLRTKGEIAKLVECMRAINFHLSEDTDPHQMRIEQFAAQLLENLYIKYRMLGYVTDKEEMYRRMFYDLELATWAEIKGKQESTKALHVPGFRYLTDEHELDVNSHHGLFSQFLDKNACPYTPVISLKHFATSRILETTEAGNNSYTTYIIKEDWCPTQGCVVVGMHYVQPITPTKLLSITNGITSLDCYVEPLLGLTVYLTDPSTPKTLIHIDSIDYTDFTYGFTLSYDTKHIYFKSILSQDTTILEIPNIYLDPIHIHFYAPWKEKDMLKSTLKSFWYYNQTITSGAMLTSILS